MLGLLLHPLVLCLLVWLVARSTAEFNFGRMVLVSGQPVRPLAFLTLRSEGGIPLVLARRR